MLGRSTQDSHDPEKSGGRLPKIIRRVLSMAALVVIREEFTHLYRHLMDGWTTSGE
jgi:hypothetical protein